MPFRLPQDTCAGKRERGISNALNESLEGIEEWEFATRMGATRAEVMELLDALIRLQSSGQG